MYFSQGFYMTVWKSDMASRKPVLSIKIWTYTLANWLGSDKFIMCNVDHAKNRAVISPLPKYLTLFARPAFFTQEAYT